MENFYLKATENTPEISFKVENSTLDIKGTSYPENTFEFYQLVLDWLNNYFEEVDNSITTVINFEIIYYNSSSSKVFLDIFDIFEVAHENDKKMEINWIYSAKNESAMETGEDFQEDFEELNIKLVEK